MFDASTNDVDVFPDFTENKAPPVTSGINLLFFQRLFHLVRLGCCMLNKRARGAPLSLYGVKICSVNCKVGVLALDIESATYNTIRQHANILMKFMEIHHAFF